MRKIGDEPRLKLNVYIDESLRDFLEELREELKLSISQIIEQATISQFRQDYDEFISRKEKES